MVEKELVLKIRVILKKAKDLRPTLYVEKVIGLGYTRMFLTHSDEALEIEKFKRSRENKIDFAYDYANLNASYVNEKINFEEDYFQEIINPDFEKTDSPFQQTSLFKPYVPNVILEKIIIDLEDEVVNLLEKEKVNSETIESLKSKSFESSEMVSSESENQSENDCPVVENECDKEENPKVIAPGTFKLNVSQYVSLISMSKSSCDSNNVEIKLKRKRHLDSFSSVRRHKNSGVIWKKKGSSNTTNVDSGCSKHMMGNRALLTNFVEKFLGTVRFGNNDFVVIAGYGDVVIDGVDLLTGDLSSNLYTINLNEVASNSSTCLLEKASSSQSWLWHQRLSHLNFATINNLVKNNLIQGLPRMKFKKDHLCSTCEQGKIHRKHHKSKTAFFFKQASLSSSHGFVWADAHSKYKWKSICAEAIATACLTQNRLIIHKRFDKTPYELINKRKPNIKFFYVFECRCYLQNDYEDVGKLKAKGDIGVFVGYSKESDAFRIYNKRTHKIHESVNVNFDEILEMASKQFSLEPGLSNLNKTGKSSNSSVSQVLETSKKYLFQNFYDEYFDSSKIMKSSTMNVETSNVEISSHEDEFFHESSKSFQEESSSSSLNDDVH
nr:hypothetical protein [Tanacetum cinerariifolium]